MDWQKIGDYNYTKNLGREGWAWEFLRRNPDYIDDYKTYRQTFFELESKYGPWNSADKEAWRKDPKSHFFVPGKNDGESITQWRERCYASGCEPKIYCLESWHAKKWQLARMYSPECPYSPQIQFTDPWPKIISYDSLDDYFYTPDEPHAPAQQVPEKCLLGFDLTLPIGRQLKEAKTILTKAQKCLQENKSIPSTKTKEHSALWDTYLRILDAKKTGTGASDIEIAKKLFPNDIGADPKGKVKDTYKQALAQAKRYQHILYRTKAP